MHLSAIVLSFAEDGLDAVHIRVFVVYLFVINLCPFWYCHNIHQ